MDLVTGKRVLFITTKELQYLRNTQEIEVLQKEGAEVDIIGSESKNYPKRLLKVYFQLLFCRMKKYDGVMIGFAPQLVLPFFGWKFRNMPVTIDFFISLYDTFVFDRKKFSADSFIGKYLKKLDEATIHRANRVIADTKHHGAYFVSEFGLNEEKLLVMYLKADTNIFWPREQKKPARMDGKFVILYFGSVLPLQGIDVILKAIELLKERKDLYFIMVGPIQDKYEKVQASNIEYHDWLPQEELADYISYSDLCLAGHFNAEINKAKRTIPGKAYIYRAMERPMILGKNPANMELYAPEDEGIYYVQMGNPEALAEKIVQIKECV